MKKLKKDTPAVYVLKVYLFDDKLKKCNKKPFFEAEFLKLDQLEFFYNQLNDAKEYVLFEQVIFLKKYFHHAVVAIE